MNMIFIVPENTCEIKVDCNMSMTANFSQINAFIICDPHINIALN